MYYFILASDIREEYQLGHTFDSEARIFYGLKPNSVVVFNSQHLVTKWDKKWYAMTVDVSPLINLVSDIRRFVYYKCRLKFHFNLFNLVKFLYRIHQFTETNGEG